MKRWKLWSGLIVLFLAGGVFGGVATGLTIKWRVTQVIKGGPPAVREVIMKRLDQKLDLNAKQHAAIESEIAQAQEQLHTLRLRSLPEVEKIFQGGFSRIKPLLNNEQQKTYEELHSKLEEHVIRMKSWKVKQQEAQ